MIFWATPSLAIAWRTIFWGGRQVRHNIFITTLLRDNDILMSLLYPQEFCLILPVSEIAVRQVFTDYKWIIYNRFRHIFPNFYCKYNYYNRNKKYYHRIFVYFNYLWCDNLFVVWLFHGKYILLQRWYNTFNCFARCSGSKTDSCLHQYSSATTCWSGICCGLRWSYLYRSAWFPAPSIVSTICAMLRLIVSIPRSVIARLPLELWV